MTSLAKILVIGSGGREHALAWRISLSEKVETVFVAPGNGGTSKDGKIANVSIPDSDIPALVRFAQENKASCVKS